MSTKVKSVPRDWQVIMDEETISRALSRMSFEILEKDRDLKNLAVVGIRTMKLSPFTSVSRAESKLPEVFELMATAVLT